MAIEITVPRLGWSMEEGTLTEWLKREGEFVRKGDLLFVLEGDKAAQEIECFDEGILRLLPDGPRPGDVVKVGQVIAVLLAENESPPAAANPPARQQESQPPRIVSESAQISASEPLTRTAQRPSGSPSARRAARKQQASAAALQPLAATTEVAAEVSVGGSRVRPRSSPRARRAANRLGIELRDLRGTGRSGRVLERDVLSHAERRGAPAEPVQETRIPHSATRRTIAARMLASHLETAPVTLTTTADATNLVNLRNQFRTHAGEQPVPSFTILIAKLTALVLREFPHLNARWEADAVIQYGAVHLGLAVDTDSGLIVPVLRDADRQPLRDLNARALRLIEQAQSRRLSPEELQGGTFTISNLGVYGIDAFTPIINGPQCAILGLGRIQSVPACVNGAIVPRDQITLSLTFDHRLVDGAPAARFLQAVVQAIENPAARLIA